METAEISSHLLRVFTTLRDEQGWITAQALSAKAEVARRTARAHLARLVKLGLADVAEVYPGHRYRLSPMAEKRNKGMLERLKAAEEVFA